MPSTMASALAMAPLLQPTPFILAAAAGVVANAITARDATTSNELWRVLFMFFFPFDEAATLPDSREDLFGAFTAR